jgi:hypothetical protein
MAGKTAASLDIDDSEVRRLLDRLRRDAPKEAAKAVERTADGLLGSLQNDWLSRAGSGRVYPSATGRGTHRASAPGEPPAPDTTSYRESWDVTQVDPTGLAWIVFTPDERGPWLEYGTTNMQPRPHALPAAVAHKRFFENEIRKAAATIERGRLF